MNSKTIILFAAAVLMVLPAYAEYSELVHEDWHVHKENFSVEGINFTVKAGGSILKALVNTMGTSVIIENGTCSTVSDMEICLTEVGMVGFDEPILDLHKEYMPGDYKYYIEISFNLANLAITRSFRETAIRMGERTFVESRIFNDGSLAAEDVVFTDSYPYFTISEITGPCFLEGSKVKWAGRLGINQYRECSYYIAPKEPGSFETKATAEYYGGVGAADRDSESDEVTIDVPEFEIDMDSAFSSESAKTGDSVMLSINLSNVDNEKTVRNIMLSIDVPESLRTSGFSESLSSSGTTLKWTGTMEPESARSFNITFTASISGDIKISPEISYNIGGVRREFNTTSGINVSSEKLLINFINFPESDVSGNTTALEVTISNPSSVQEFRSIYASVESELELPVNMVSSASLAPNRFISVVSGDFTFPEVSEETEYTVLFRLDYETEFGEKFSVSESRTLAVKPSSLSHESGGEPDGAGDDSGGFLPEGVKSDIEEFGVGKFALIFTAVALVFIFSGVFFLKRMLRGLKKYSDEDETEEY